MSGDDLPAALATRAARRGRRRCGCAGRRCGDAAGRGRRAFKTDVVKGVNNPTTTTTSVTDSGAGSTVVSGLGHRRWRRVRAGRDECGRRGCPRLERQRPSGRVPPLVHRVHRRLRLRSGTPWDRRGGYGVWGDSPDIGVYGSGGLGVLGYGGVGVEGDANSASGSVGVWAWAPTTSQVALKVTGKVSLSRSGRHAMASGTSSKAVSLTGVTTTSKVFAVLSTSESGRYVRAVVPAAGKFTIYLNTALTSSAVVSWFVLD